MAPPAIVRMVAAGVGLVLLSYVGITAISDNTRMHHQLQTQQVELETINSKMASLQSQIAEDGDNSAPTPDAFYRQRGNQQRRKSRQAWQALKRLTRAAELEQQDTKLTAQEAVPPTPAIEASAVAAVSPAVAALQKAALVIPEGRCREAWLRQATVSSAQSSRSVPLPYAGGNLEHPGVMEAMLAARAPDKELIFLSVGDTRDHRRAQKDPVALTPLRLTPHAA